MSDVNKFFDAKQSVETELYYLKTLACSFGAVGNETVRDNLLEVSKQIQKKIDEMQQVYKGDLDNAFKRAEENSVNVLKAVLAGGKIASGNKE